MPFEAAIIIAIFILVTTFVVMVVLIASRRQAAKVEEMKREASARGWHFETRREKGHRVHRWTGTTEGVSWVAESLSQAPSGKSREERHRQIARWHGSWSPGIHGAILAMGMPKGKEPIGTRIAAGESWVARLAQKAAGFAFDRAIDVHFGDGPGKGVDAGAMHRLETKTPGFVVMAADKDEGARVLAQGLEKALADAANDQASVLSNEKRPWILFLPSAVLLARMERFRNAADIESFVRAGVALTRTSKFSRPLS